MTRDLVPDLQDSFVLDRIPAITCLLPVFPGEIEAQIGKVVRDFEAQTYPKKELVLVYAADREPDSKSLPAVTSVARVCRSESGSSLGDLLDAGCEQAGGTIIAHWSARPHYSADHLARLARPLLQRLAHIHVLPFDSETAGTGKGQAPSAVPGGSSLAYWKHVWQKLLRHPRGARDTERQFCLAAQKLGAICVGSPDEGAYSGLGAGLSEGPQIESLDYPLVSCLMPTFERPRFARRAIHYFLRQDYPNKELIVLDDSARPDWRLMDAAEASGKVTYIYLHGKYTLGLKRSLACRLARGPILASWDDDDWYGERRLSQQAEPILDGRAELSALTFGLVFFVESQKMFYNPDPDWVPVADGTMMFTRELHDRLGGFVNVVFPDTVFLQRARKRGVAIVSVANSREYLYLRHGRNLWQMPWETLGRRPRELDPSLLLPEPDLEFYRHLAAAAL